MTETTTHSRDNKSSHSLTTSKPGASAASAIDAFGASAGKSLHAAFPDKMEIESIALEARGAFQTIRKLSVSQRLLYIKALRQVILSNQEKIIAAVQKDAGKSRTDALVSEIFSVLDALVFLEKHATKMLAPETVPTPIALMGKKSKIHYAPMGTVLVISPWNYPFYQAIVPCTAALVAGNAVIYKPSEYTPLVGLIEGLLQEAGIPQHFIQVVYGDGNTGKMLIEQKPQKIFFTGSVKTGKAIMKQASDHLIPVELELGGKDPMIVFEDANIERATAGALWGGLTTSGQSCTSVERLYVHNDIYDAFKTRLLERASQITLGIDDKKSTDLGRMTTGFQVKLVKELLEDAIAKGATQLTGRTWDGQAFLIPPLILENVPASARLVQEEIFGPIIPLYRFYNEEEAIYQANNSDYGLSASIWTNDLVRAERVADEIITGNISINNVMLSEGNSALPFGGVKDSGIGRYKGRVGLHSFTNIKSVIIDKNSAKIEANWYPYTEKKYELFDRLTHTLYSGGILNFIKFALTGIALESHSAKVGKTGERS